MDHGEDRLLLFEDIIVPETQDAEAHRLDRFCSRRVLRQPSRMLAPIQLDDQPAFEAGEIDDMAANGMLAPELAAHQAAIAQVMPYLAFGIGD